MNTARMIWNPANDWQGDGSLTRGRFKRHVGYDFVRGKGREREMIEYSCGRTGEKRERGKTKVGHQ
jgi:hypothetical protein